jgi:hypothetical protein
MANASRLMKAFMTPGVGMGIGIGAINLYNFKRSPIYQSNGLNNLQIGMGIAAKSIIYSTFWPVATLFITLDIYNDKKDFDRHFIPFSVHDPNQNR